MPACVLRSIHIPPWWEQAKKPVNPLSVIGIKNGYELISKTWNEIWRGNIKPIGTHVYLHKKINIRFLCAVSTSMVKISTFGNKLSVIHIYVLVIYTNIRYGCIKPIGCFVYLNEKTLTLDFRMLRQCHWWNLNIWEYNLSCKYTASHDLWIFEDDACE